MRKAIETLKNIWKIEDLRQRILITILFVAIYRFGSYVVLPGINPAMLAKLHEQTSEGLLALLNMFSGGAFSNASIFALGIMPYISASIVIQLLAGWSFLECFIRLDSVYDYLYHYFGSW